MTDVLNLTMVDIANLIEIANAVDPESIVGGDDERTSQFRALMYRLHGYVDKGIIIRVHGHGRAPALTTTDQEKEYVVDLMSAWSEDRWCAGWNGNLDEMLHEEGGVWEAIGRRYGWPLGYRGEDGWVTWDEAGEHYAQAGKS